MDVADIGSRWPHDFVWTGEGAVVFDGNTYVGGLGGTLQVSPISSEEGQPIERVQLTLDASDGLVRAALLRDPGPLEIIIRWIYSADNGTTWNAIPRRAVGILSPEPGIIGNEYKVTLEFESGRDDQPRPQMWSHEESMARSTGEVTYGGMEWVPELAAQTTVEWPPGHVLADFYENQQRNS